MMTLLIDHETKKHQSLPTFSLEVRGKNTAAIYSSTELQNEFITLVKNERSLHLYDYKENLYDRLSVRDNLAFFHKWSGCSMPLSEVLVTFHLHFCAINPLSNCTPS